MKVLNLKYLINKNLSKAFKHYLKLGNLITNPYLNKHLKLSET